MTYNIFISHSWSYHEHYDGLLRLLDSNPYFSYKNYSVPKDDPIHNASNQEQLKAAIRRQMQPASCIIVLAGMYTHYSKWIDIEISLAKEMGKRIIAVEPWGSQKTSLIVKNSAHNIVGWNAASVISAIRGF